VSTTSRYSSKKKKKENEEEQSTGTPSQFYSFFLALYSTCVSTSLSICVCASMNTVYDLPFSFCGNVLW
jgi:hypothetical protein